jgi:RNA polymerase sigma-70 factor (ECF subfamily)
MGSETRTATEDLFGDFGWVRRLARSLVRDESSVDDLVQETWLATLRRRPEDGPPPRSWVATVLRNLVRQRARGEGSRRDRERRVATPEGLPSSDELAERMERQRLLAEAVMRLDEPFRSTVILRYTDNLQPTAISRMQGVPAATVRGRLKTGLERLREDLDRVYGGGELARRRWMSALFPLAASRAPEAALAASTKTLWVGGMWGMKKVVVSVIALLAIGGAWFGVRALTVLEPASLASAEAADVIASAGAEDSPAALTSSISKGGEPERVALAKPPAIRNTHELEGRVVLPLDCRNDDALAVFALDEPVSYREFALLMDRAVFEKERAERLANLVVASAPVEPDGSFRLELEDAEDELHLIARGRRLYTPESKAVTGGAPSVLHVESGAWIQGRVAEADTDRALSGEIVVLVDWTASMSPTGGMLGTTFQLQTVSDAEGRFELRAVPPTERVRLYTMPAHYAAQRVAVEDVEACRDRSVTLGHDGGGVVRGRVVDVDGSPIGGASVRCSFPSRWGALGEVVVRTAISDAEGRFELVKVPRGSIVVRARASGYVESPGVAFDRPAGLDLDDVRLELARGESIEGVLAWTDERPAPGVRVVAEFDPAYLGGDSGLSAMRGAQGETYTDEAGHFVVAGIGDGPFVVRAETTGEDGETRYRSQRDGVLPGDDPLAMLLHPPLSIAGMVVDQSGRPLEVGHVYATRIVFGSFGETGLDREDTALREKGHFELDDLIEGTWELWAESEDSVPVELARVELPFDQDPVLLSVKDGASVAGRVIDPNGQGVRGAEVRARSEYPAWQDDVAPGRRLPRVRTGEGGRFVLRGLEPGSIVLFAQSDEHAPGPDVALELAPGRAPVEVTLELLRGATLTGEVFDEDGLPARGRLVHLEHAEGETRFFAADDQGRFEVHYLIPGAWGVSAFDLSMVTAGVAPENGAFDELLSSMVWTLVELADGGAEHVVLGAPPEAPVTVTGRVHQGGRAHGGSWMTFFGSDGGAPESMKTTVTDKDGFYEVTLDTPGDYGVSVQLQPGTEDENTVDFQHTIPVVSEHRLDLELPSARLSGIVLRPDGRPAEAARVTLASEGHEGSDTYHQGHYIEVATDGDGRFDVSGLFEGEFWVAAGGAPYEPGMGPAYARVVLDGIELAVGEHRSDISIQLPEPGGLVVSVLDERRQPAEGATVFVRDAGGNIVDALSGAVTDATGTCRIETLASGAYTLCARSGGLASLESQPVRVLEGAFERAQLELAAGSRLLVHLVDEKGVRQRGWVSVFDHEEREVGALYAYSEAVQLYLDGAFSPSSPRFGPLPPGKYRVDARVFGGGQASREVVIDGHDEIVLTLKIGT